MRLILPWSEARASAQDGSAAQGAGAAGESPEAEKLDASRVRKWVWGAWRNVRWGSSGWFGYLEYGAEDAKLWHAGQSGRDDSIAEAAASGALLIKELMRDDARMLAFAVDELEALIQVQLALARVQT